MSPGKHDRARDGGPFPDDLERDPGIGRSKGAFATGEDPEELAGVNTAEGDVENEANRLGGADEGRLGRANE